MEGSGIDPNCINALGTGRVVDLSAIAAVTEGFTGAELEFLVNEAAIRAVRCVSAALHANSSNVKAGDVITPHVEAADFEASLANFYQTRRSSSSTGTMPDLFKNMFKTTVELLSKIINKNNALLKWKQKHSGWSRYFVGSI